MQVFNCDETGLSVVHRPGKVMAEVRRRNVYAVTSGEKGKTHTVVSCVSASGYVLPPMMIYPRKQSLPEKFREGAVANTLLDVGVNYACTLLRRRFSLMKTPEYKPEAAPTPFPVPANATAVISANNAGTEASITGTSSSPTSPATSPHSLVPAFTTNNVQSTTLSTSGPSTSRFVSPEDR